MRTCESPTGLQRCTDCVRTDLVDYAAAVRHHYPDVFLEGGAAADCHGTYTASDRVAQLAHEA